MVRISHLRSTKWYRISLSGHFSRSFSRLACLPLPSRQSGELEPLEFKTKLTLKGGCYIELLMHPAQEHPKSLKFHPESRDCV